MTYQVMTPTNQGAFLPLRYGPLPPFSRQEKFAISLLFPSLFSDYFCKEVAKEIETVTNKWSRLFLAPLGTTLNLLLLPFTIVASVVSIIAMAIFMGFRDRIAGDFPKEAWNLAIRIALYTTFVSPMIVFSSLFTSLIDPTFSVVDRVFGGFPAGILIMDTSETESRAMSF